MQNTNLAPKPDSSNAKKQAALRALDFVESGMIVGLGSGSTATEWIHLLGEKVRNGQLKISAVASSEDSERLGRSYGIPFVSLDENPQVDLTVDGADEIAPGLALIKGGGGKLLREKIVASASRKMIIVADASKLVTQLGKFPLPIEVIPMARALVTRALEDLGFKTSLRHTKAGEIYITDEGNHILDCSGVMLSDPTTMGTKLDSIVGVVEHGLFLGRASLAIISDGSSIIEKTPTDRWN